MDAGGWAEVVAELETAYEELRVADEEVRSQHHEIEQLRSARGEVPHHHDRMVAALPVPALLTDAAGVIRSANVEAAALLGVAAGRMTGRPLFMFFEPGHASDLRNLLSRSRRGPARSAIWLAAQTDASLHVTLAVSARRDELSSHTWLLLPVGPEQGVEMSRVPDAVLELTRLLPLGRDTQGVLDQAARICRGALGGADVSIALGDLDHPGLCAATSVLAETIDNAQTSARRGPRFVALAERATVTCTDLVADLRWPAGAPPSSDAPIAAVVVPIEIGSRLGGALSVYAPHEINPWVESAAGLLSLTLGAMFYELELSGEQARLTKDAELSLASVANVEMARGIIMAQRRCGADEAFAYLCELSGEHGVALRDVAVMIVNQTT